MEKNRNCERPAVAAPPPSTPVSVVPGLTMTRDQEDEAEAQTQQAARVAARRRERFLSSREGSPQQGSPLAEQNRLRKDSKQQGSAQLPPVRRSGWQVARDSLGGNSQLRVLARKQQQTRSRPRATISASSARELSRRVANREHVSSRAAIRALLLYAAPALLRFCFFIYPFVTRIAFEAFPCFDFGEDGRWMEADVSIDCDSDRYGRVLAIAWSAILLYPGGLFVTYGLLLIAARDAIKSKRDSALAHALVFLHKPYKSHLYLWELMEMLRCFLLVGAFQLIQAGSLVQISLATTCSFTFLVIQQHAKPYVDVTNDLLALICSFSLSCFLFMVTLFKVDILVEIPSVWMRLSLDLQKKYDLPSTPLAFTMLAIVLASSIFATALVVVQALVDLEANRRKQLQRLRLKEDKSEAIPPKLPSNEYHIFLSHCWSSGQDQMRVLKQKIFEMMPECRVFLDVDDLHEGKGAEFIDKSVVVLIFVSDGYFISKNCMRELVRASMLQRPLLVLAETEGRSLGGGSHGGLTRVEADQQLRDGVARFVHWGLADEMEGWLDQNAALEPPPSEQTLRTQLREAPTFEWNRLPLFQSVVYRRIAETLLGVGEDTTYLTHDIEAARISLGRPPQPFEYHLFVSKHNAGAEALLHELGQLNTTLGGGDVIVSTDAAVLKNGTAERMLIYLDARTWTSGDSSEAFLKDVELAMKHEIDLMLVHEMVVSWSSSRASSSRRMNGSAGSCRQSTGRLSGVKQPQPLHPVVFSSFFDTTPQSLQAAGIYNQIAMPIKAKPYRRAGLLMLLHELAETAHKDRARSRALLLAHRQQARPFTSEQKQQLRSLQQISKPCGQVSVSKEPRGATAKWLKWASANELTRQWKLQDPDGQHGETLTDGQRATLFQAINKLNSVRVSGNSLRVSENSLRMSGHHDSSRSTTSGRWRHAAARAVTQPVSSRCGEQTSPHAVHFADQEPATSDQSASCPEQHTAPSRGGGLWQATARKGTKHAPQAASSRTLAVTQQFV